MTASWLDKWEQCAEERAEETARILSKNEDKFPAETREAIALMQRCLAADQNGEVGHA